MNRKFGKRLFPGLLALCVAAMIPLSVSAQTVAEIQAEQDRLQAEKDQLEAQLEQLRNDEAEKQAEQENLQEQIDVVQQQIDTTRQNINDLNASINELTMKLDASQAEIQDTIDEFKERLVALYTAGNVSTLEILLDSESLSDFTTRMQLVDSMTAHDQELVDKLEAYVDSTSAEREQVEAQKREVAELQKTLESKQDELDQLYEQTTADLVEIQGAEGARRTSWPPTRKSWQPTSRRCKRPLPPRRPPKKRPSSRRCSSNSSRVVAPCPTGGVFLTPPRAAG